MGYEKVLARMSRARQSAICAWSGHPERFVGMERRGNSVTTLRSCTRCPRQRNRTFIAADRSELPDNVVALERVG